MFLTKFFSALDLSRFRRKVRKLKMDKRRAGSLIDLIIQNEGK
jgi:hypothetical protein